MGNMDAVYIVENRHIAEINKQTALKILAYDTKCMLCTIIIMHISGSFLNSKRNKKIIFSDV